ncbi:COF family HAD hydrolase protein [Mycoplasmopsis maculosa]|uniref:COF family HAD hydrolase protein n=1 Tax=Mycoplasmopsis maculosa TaxID=114885 RepID=A0A449B5A7_9BACT|nr:HAD family hydrolase [Mycoplasmopsis maculosa]VEU75791.1 COF family HAD hydrolase protein [Mycoplasmopsis maculosa]
MKKEDLKNNIKLAAFDIDGTILPNGTMEFSSSIIKMFDKLSEKNIKTTFATAREFVTIGSLYKQLPKLDYFIGANGSFCYDIKNDNIIYEKTISYEDFKKIYDFVLNDEDTKSFLVADNKYAYKNPGMLTDTWFLSPHKDKIIDMDFEKIEKNHIHIITIGCESDDFTTRVTEKVKQLIEENNLNVDITAKWSKGIFLCPKGVTKSKTLNWLCDYLNLKINENLIAFGDSSNDFEMIRDSAYGVAMSRANDWIKSVANDIATTCEEDGAYHKLIELELI